MGLLSFLKRSAPAGAEAPAAPVFDEQSIERARTRARHRLIGAVVLLGIAVVGFPLLFETQPRPIPVDLPIEIPRKDAVPPLALASPDADSAPAAAPEEPLRSGDVPEPVAPLPPRPEAKSEPRPAPKPEPAKPEAKAAPKPDTASAVAKPEPRPAAAAPKPEPRPVAAAPKPEPRPEPKPEPKPPAREEAPAARPADSEASRARALLEGRQPEAVRVETARAPEAGGRFALQIGAFSEGGSARDARQKVERLGLRSYTQEIETAEGRRIRVRVGPFASRAEADQAAAKLRAAGLPAAMLSQ